MLASPTRNKILPKRTQRTMTTMGVVDWGSRRYLATKLAQALFTVSGYKRSATTSQHSLVPFVPVVHRLAEQEK